MAPSADRNLLFGILALQMDFIDKDALVDAMHDWMRDKAAPLGRILRDRGALAPDEHDLLDALVQKHLAKHGDDARRGLAALSSVDPWVCGELRGFADADVQQSLAAVGGGRDPRATLGLPPGPNGRYEILRPHARGGLGEVFVAADTELGRQVALKEIQARYADDPESRTRFVLEAEITGGLEHPGVVPVYGLGAYADGRPFYAMRFVKGDNLQRALKQFHAGGPGFDSLAFRQLLRRFVDVCNAVAYAHSRGVLHRDLKPGNVMLGAFGETLLVDWGLAKVVGRSEGAGGPTGGESTLRPRSGEEASGTRLGQALGTPAYMSPEQAAGRLDELGPATDVYSLGATLYELLAGRAPFAADNVAALLDDVRAGRFPPPRAVAPTVPRPLAAACLKAMALKPADRYATAQALAADVERWLADEPVTAYREPAAARARRWMKRHRTVVATTLVALVLLAAGLGALAFEREKARVEVAGARDRAVKARNRTREALDAMVSEVTGESLATQKAISEEQKKFLESVLEYYVEFAAEPGEDQEGRERLARAHYRLGMIRNRLGQREEGAAVFGQTVELFTKLAADFPTMPEYSRALAGSHNNLGSLLASLGKRAEAEANYRAAVALQEKLAADYPSVPDYRRDLAASHYNLGLLLGGLEKRAEAAVAFRAALAVREKLAADFPAVPDYRRDLAASHNGLGNVFSILGKRDEAEASYRAALAVREKLAADFPAVPGYRSDLAASHNNLGQLLAELEKRLDAEASYRAALAVREKLAADFPAVPDYRRDLAISHNGLGVLLAELGKRDEAEASFRAVLVVREKLAADFPAVPAYVVELGGSYINFATLLRTGANPAAAVAWYGKGIATLESVHRVDPRIVNGRHFLAKAYWGRAYALTSLRHHVEAKADWDRALELTDNSGERLEIRFARADNLARAGDLGAVGEAEAILQIGPMPPDRHYDAACVLAVVSLIANNPDAEAHAARAVTVLRQAIAKGYADIPHLLKDPDLDPLRRRADFAELLWDLAEMPAPTKPPR